jgi:PAS domain S-box-containing protein
MKAKNLQDPDKTKAQLLDELTNLRQQVAELQATLNECRQTNQALGDKHQSYQFIVNTSRDFMTLINRDHIYEAVNDSYCQAHQKTQNEIVGRSVAEVWGQEVYLTQVEEHLENCFAGEEAHYQGWFEFATLGRRYFDVVYYPYYGSDRMVTHAVVVSRDNTKYKQVEDQLVRSEQRYRLVSDLTSNYTYAFGLGPDNEFLLEWVTDAFTRITGFAPEEVNTRSKWIQIAHPEDVFLVDRREQALLSGQMNVTETRIVTKSGETRWLRDYIRPIWSRRLKRVVRLYGAVQDITDRKQAEEERERFTNLLRIVAGISRQLTAVLDLDQLLEEIVTLLQTQFNLYYVHVYLFDEVSDDLVMKAGSGDIGRELKERGHRILLEDKQSLVARAARKREIVVENDIKRETSFMPHPLLPYTQSELSLPLVYGDDILGVLDMQDDQIHRFQQPDLDAFNILASQVAIAIRNARLVQSLQLSEERYELAASVGRVGVWDWNLTADTVYLTPNLKAILGFEDHEIANEPEAWFQHIHPDDL